MNSLLSRLSRDERGLAFVEFAFAAPILLLLILGGLELANYAIAHLRVNQIAMTVADNAGRMLNGVDEANILEVFTGASVIGGPLSFDENGRVVLSSLQHNGEEGVDEGQVIRWQRCWGELDVQPAYGVEDAGADNNDLAEGMGLPGQRIWAAEGTVVLVAEVTYEYQPLVNYAGLPLAQHIRHESAFTMRGQQRLEKPANALDLEVLTCS